MRGLFGDFATMPLKDLVVYLGNRKATGSLSMERDVVRKQVVLHEGQVVNASSNEPREYLGQFLINLGHITEEQFQRAYDTQKETHVFLGRVLVMIGAVTEDVVANALSLKMRETLLEAFQWHSGTFAFEPDKVSESPAGVDLAIPLTEIHRESELRETVWQAVRRVFPSGKASLVLHRANLAEVPRPGSLDARLIKLIEDGFSIDELVLRLHATDFFLYQRLIALHRLDAISVDDEQVLEMSIDDPVEALDDTDSPGPDTLVANAHRLADQGSLRDAVALVRRANQLKTTPETSALLQDLENRWLAALRVQLLGKRHVPLLVATADQIRAQSLTAPEKYLLSRLDGKRTLFHIVSVSPLRELDALGHFERFVEKKLISL